MLKYKLRDLNLMEKLLKLDEATNLSTEINNYWGKKQRKKKWTSEKKQRNQT